MGCLTVQIQEKSHLPRQRVKEIKNCVLAIKFYQVFHYSAVGAFIALSFANIFPLSGCLRGCQELSKDFDCSHNKREI